MFYVVTESGLLLLSNKELSGKEFVRKCPHKLDNIFQEFPNPLTPIPPIPAPPHPALPSPYLMTGHLVQLF